MLKLTASVTKILLFSKGILYDWWLRNSCNQTVVMISYLKLIICLLGSIVIDLLDYIIILRSESFYNETNFCSVIFHSVIFLNKFWWINKLPNYTFKKVICLVFDGVSVKTISRVKRSSEVIWAIFDHFCKIEKARIGAISWADIGSVWAPILMFNKLVRWHPVHKNYPRF